MINLTQHKATPEQSAAGLVDMFEPDRATLTGLLTFDTLPSTAQVRARAFEIAALVKAKAPHEVTAMIGGAPFLMASLESALLSRGVSPLYAFSVRESEEQTQPDGSVRKIAVFKHGGWVSAGN